MFDHRSHRIDHRIVSISQPHVRPIVRGKTRAPVEFGAKISASVVNGYAMMEELDWDNYNEALSLQAPLKAIEKGTDFTRKLFSLIKFTETGKTAGTARNEASGSADLPLAVQQRKTKPSKND